MAIAFDTTGSTAATTGVTSATADITTAATGAWVYLWVGVVNSAAAEANIASTGWSSLLQIIDAGNTTGHYALLRRQKQAGDTTFTVTWPTAGHGTLGWASYTGLDGTTPDEGAAIANNGTTSRSAVPTPSATPTAANRWALALFFARTSTTANKNIDWTPDASTTERLDVNCSAAASAAWNGLEIADTNGTVSQASHSYTATHNVTGTPTNESHDASAILFLIPATAAAATRAPQVISQYTGFF